MGTGPGGPGSGSSAVEREVKLGAPDRPVAFTVPTGNFGNVYAGYAAQRMGLPISRTIIEAHGGRLWAENNNGTGATFRFTLPPANEAKAS